MTQLFIDFSFQDRLQPRHITAEVREELVRRELRRFRPWIFVPIIAVLGVGVFWLSALTALWSRIWVYEALAIVPLIAVALIIRNRGVRLLREGVPTAGVVTDVEPLSFYGGLGGANHWIRVRFRFVHGEGDLPESRLLRDDAPCCQARRWVPGGWGSFGEDLQPGSLVSVLYWPDRPQRCRLIALRCQDTKMSAVEETVEDEDGVRRDRETGEPV